MKKEELALRYQQGQTEVIGALWDAVEKFVRSRAWQFAETLPPERGLTLDDLVQIGFIAVTEAAKTYAPDGGASFLTWLTYHLRNEFIAAAGYRRRHPDPLNDSRTAWLDSPLDADDADGASLGDEIPDGRIDVDSAVVDKVCQAALRHAGRSDERSPRDGACSAGAAIFSRRGTQRDRLVAWLARHRNCYTARTERSGVPQPRRVWKGTGGVPVR